MRSSRQPLSRATTLLICVAVLATVPLGVGSLSAASAADEYVVFTWGGRQRVVDHEVDLEGGRLRLMFDAESSVDIPLSSVSRIVDTDHEVVLDLTLGGATMDAWDPPDAALWSPIEGWSQEEVWRPRGSHPRWAFRWTDSETAWAVVSEPPAGAAAVEMRIMSIRHPIQVAGKVADPGPQRIKVSLNGQALGERELAGRGWHTYRFPLPAGCRSGLAHLELEVSYLARPEEFTGGRSRDRRELGVAVNYVRFVTDQGTL
jgi:hypothetical protein